MGWLGDYGKSFLERQCSPEGTFPIKVIYVRDFLEARHIAKTPNPPYIGGDYDLYRLNGIILNEESPPIYVSRNIDVVKFMEIAVARFRPLGEGKCQ